MNELMYMCGRPSPCISLYSALVWNQLGYGTARVAQFILDDSGERFELGT